MAAYGCSASRGAASVIVLISWLGAAAAIGMWGSPAPPAAPGLSIASIPSLNRLITFGDASATRDGRGKTFVFTNNEWSRPVVAPSEVVTESAVWVDGEMVYAHSGREAGCDSQSSLTVAAFNASSLMWSEIEVTITPESQAALVQHPVWSFRRSEHCAQARPGTPWLVVLFGGLANTIDHYWVIDTRNWTASVFPLQSIGGVVTNTPGGDPRPQKASRCLMVGDLLYYSADMEQDTNYTAMRNLGAFNLSSGLEVLSSIATPQINGDGARLQVGAEGALVQLNATTLLAFSGCDAVVEVLCTKASERAWLVHGLDDPTALVWEAVTVSWGSAVPALLVAAAPYRPQRLASRRGSLRQLYTDEPIGWFYPGVAGAGLRSGPMFQMSLDTASGPVLKFEQVPKNPERMPYATFGGAAAALPSGDVFIMGGCHDVLESVSSLSQCVNTSNSFVVFQPATGKVIVPHTTVAPATAALLKPGMTVPAPMFLHAMTVFEGKVYMAGGLTPLGLADFSDPLSPPFHKMAVSTLGATVLDLATMQWSLLLACEPAACAQRWFSLNMVFTSMGGFVSFPIDDGSDTSLDLVWFGGIVITQSDLVGFLGGSAKLSLEGAARLMLISSLATRVAQPRVSRVRGVLYGNDWDGKCYVDSCVIPSDDNAAPRRRIATALARASDTTALMFGGGTHRGNAFDDLWLWHHDTLLWEELHSLTGCQDQTSPQVAPIKGVASAAVVGSSLIVLGPPPGEGVEQNTTAVYDTETKAWSLVESATSVPSRFVPAVAAAGGVLYMIGGTSFTTGEASVPSNRIDVFRSGVYEYQVSAQGDDALCQLSVTVPCRSLQVASAILGTPNPVLPRSAPRSFIQLAADAVTTFDEQVPGLSTTGLQLAFPITISGQLTSRVTINCGALQKCGSVQSGATSVAQFPCIAVNTGSLDQPVLLRNVDLSGACGEPAIDVAESALWLWDVKLSGNRAQQGSTVHARGAVVQARNLDAVDNHATESGGVVWASGSTVNLTSSTFRHNSASVFGGAVYLEFSSLTGIDVVFHNNSVEATALRNVAGGAVFATGPKHLLLESAHFVENRLVSPISDQVTAQGGGLCALGSSPRLFNVTFDSNAAREGGGAFFAQEASPTLADVTFRGNQARTTGGGGLVCSLCNSVSVLNSRFEGNVAGEGNGGAARLDRVLGALAGGHGMLQCSFTGNRADTGNGGAVHVVGTLLNVSGSSFYGNRADTGGGGAIFWEGDGNEPAAMPYASVGEASCSNDCDLHHNCALYGCSVATPGRRLSVPGVSDGLLKATSSSGAVVAPAWQAVLVDKYGQRVESESKLTVSAVDESQDGHKLLAGFARVPMQAGAAVFNSLRVQRSPAVPTGLKLEASGSESTIVPASLRIELAGCAVGEFLSVDNDSQLATCLACPKGTHQSNASRGAGLQPSCVACEGGRVATRERQTECTPCAPGTSSTNPTVACSLCPVGKWSKAEATQCEACPSPGARCSSGQLSLEPGYWSERATDVANVTSETIFIQCLFVDACLAVDNGTRHECRFPNRGRLCALCEDGHTTFGGGCVACPAPGANVAIVVALAAMVVAGLSYLVFRKPVDKARSASAGVVRIGINFFQLNAGVGALRMHKSTFMQQYLDISSASNGISLDLVPIRCMLDSPYYSSLLIYITMPMMLAGIVALLTVARGCADRARGRPAGWKGLWGVFSSTVVPALFLVHMVITKASFGIFDVFPQQIGGRWYLSSDMGVEAGGSTYALFCVLSVLSIVAWTIGIPALGAAIMIRYRASLGDSSFHASYGFMYDGYDVARGLYLWEIVVMLRKTAIVAVVAFVASEYVQMVLAVALIMTALSLQLAWRPYTAPLLNRLEAFSLVASLGVTLSSLFYWQEPALGEVLSAAVVAVLIVFPTVLVCILAQRYYRRWRRAKFAAAGLALKGRPAAPSPLSPASSTTTIANPMHSPHSHPAEALRDNASSGSGAAGADPSPRRPTAMPRGAGRQRGRGRGQRGNSTRHMVMELPTKHTGVVVASASVPGDAPHGDGAAAPSSAREWR